MNTFGRLLRISSWGESHGIAVGGMLDGLPSGIAIDMDVVQQEVWQRSPGRSRVTSSRQEMDTVEILSGVWQGVTTGHPIAFIVRNSDGRSSDYDHLRTAFRPSHADYTYTVKYGIRDHRGGGRASARETLVRVIAGAIVRQWLSTLDIEIAAWASQIGPICLLGDSSSISWEQVRTRRTSLLRCPDAATEASMVDLIERVRQEGDSIGGVISCRMRGVVAGLGEPIYDKLHARLAQAMLSINAVRGFEVGDGFSLAHMRGSEANDAMYVDPKSGQVRHRSNHSGGILGGISSGEDIYIRVALKPTPTISLEQETIDTEGRSLRLAAHGRHDPCVVPRALPVIEAMCALVIGDFILLKQAHLPSQHTTQVR